MTNFVAIAVCIALAACIGAKDEDKPYIEFIGGGFIFNYRLAEAGYGFVAGVKRPIPSGTVLEAEFENPAGGDPMIVRQTARWGRTSYHFRTPPVQGVKASRDYHVELRLIDPASREVIAHYTKTYRSDVDQDILPDAPLVVGPGYQQPKERQAEKRAPSP